MKKFIPYSLYPIPYTLYLLTVFLICTYIPHVAAQSTKKSNQEFIVKFDKAEEFLENENYIKALPILFSLDSMDPGNANIKYKIGQCYLHSALEKEKAIPFFEKSVHAVNPTYTDATSSERRAPVMAWFDLAHAYHLNYRFDTAVSCYQQFKKILSEKEKILINRADRQIQMCHAAKQLVTNPTKAIITNLGSTVNSSYPDYSPVITADESELIFTTRRPTTDKVDESGQAFEDIYKSDSRQGLWTEALPLDTAVNTPGHEATIGISIDGQFLLIYKDDNGNGNVYQSYFNGEHWSKPEKFPGDLNSPYWETHAVYSATGNTVYFVSDRPGGFGGRDIYRVKRFPSGQWSLAQNLGPCVNTAFDEDAPFMHPDGQTIYFSSNGFNSMGGFDIFSAKIEPETDLCTPPENVGYPINTPDDDVFYVVSTDGKRGYYSSIKKGGFGDKDIYMVTVPEAEEKFLSLIKGVFTDISGNVPEEATITVTDNETGEVVGVYRPNPKTGKFLFILPQGKNYNVAYEAPKGNLFQSENLQIPAGTAYSEINQAIELQAIRVGSSIILANLFFEPGKSSLRSESLTELERLIKLMNDNKGLIVEISGHTDSKGSDEFNLQLSNQRALSVVKHIAEKGIDSKRMDAIGYGESKPLFPNTNPDGTDNAEGMAKNRRIELKIIQVDAK